VVRVDAAAKAEAAAKVGVAVKVEAAARVEAQVVKAAGGAAAKIDVAGIDRSEVACSIADICLSGRRIGKRQIAQRP
jgi:hypothetical protein